MIKKENTSFKGDVLRLVSGTGLAQIIILAIAPILTRLYSPDAFGQAALFATTASVFAVVACMSYEYAIMSPKSDKHAASLLAISFVICTLFVVCILVPLLFFFGTVLLTWIKMEELDLILWLIPLMVWFNGVFLAMNYWNTRTKHFTRLSITRVLRAATVNGGSLGLGFVGHTSGSYMIISQVAGQAVSTAVLGGIIFRENGSLIKASLSWRSIKALLSKYKNFPVYYTVSNLVNILSSQLPVILFGIFFSPTIVGFYTLALRLLQVPVGLIGGAISQVFYEKAATARFDGTLSNLVDNTFEKLVNIGVFPILLTGIFSIELFSFIFGENWAEAGLYAGFLSPYIAVIFVSSPLSILSAILDKQKTAFMFSSSWLLFSVISFIVGIILNNSNATLALYAASSALLFFVRIFIYHHWVSISIKRTLSLFKTPLLASCGSLFIYVAMKLYHLPYQLFLIIYIIIISLYVLVIIKIYK